MEFQAHMYHSFSLTVSAYAEWCPSSKSQVGNGTMCQMICSSVGADIQAFSFQLGSVWA